eukprot:CAMPEP_0175710330 /NCGR_PEP_ID=MMETSP0097-20121207/40027_1 /TAXON_ID=311494 /ORGANISM="Alexandrium monilatum, Strain CCMP3105" /LENGTH=124 /DNA_ID=CAMNT_0017017747 /DNA_START=29 /DNA_END=401 /DNA_ORIENTATION=+
MAAVPCIQGLQCALPCESGCRHTTSARRRPGELLPPRRIYAASRGVLRGLTALQRASVARKGGTEAENVCAALPVETSNARHTRGCTASVVTLIASSPALFAGRREESVETQTNAADQPQQQQQ